MRGWLVAVAIASAGCTHYAGVSVAPNGVVWIVRNTGGGGAGAQAEGVYACAVRGPELQCTRVEVRGMP